MKVKTSITLSEGVLDLLEQHAIDGESRSETIERLLRESFAQQERRERDRKDLELINQHADRLNEEAEDVLKYQVEM
jgi:metal-responsive CopG/Arc/MetJ family transcriptional regulator